MSSLALDAHGLPVLVADHVEPSTDSTALELARRRDAVRSAAREFEDLSEQDLRERLRGVTSRPLDAADLQQLRDDVRAQVLDDLVDLLDQARMGRLRKRRHVRIQAPKGYVVKCVHGLSEVEAADVEARLRARGWGDVDVREALLDKRPRRQ